MYLNIYILPFISFLIIGLLGRYMGNKGILRLINLNMSILMILVLLLIKEYYLNGNILKIELLKRLNIDILKIDLYIYLEDISQLMLLIIISITYIVLIYSYDYMINDPHIIRFKLYIILFIFFMLILISVNSLPIIFIGWEGVGISSYLLISFWYTRFNTQIGSLIALLMNRVGDMLFILGILLSLLLIGSLDLISLNIDLNINYDLIIITFIIAAMAKSAQIYLHLWLPYSMEGPTPISALIHAATMVTAGVYLLLRLNELIINSYYSLIILFFIGSLTSFIGGCLAIISFDLKELIAYSTMSQLGYMITIIGLKANNLSYFHLIFHAYFKALLFLTAGAIIHNILDLQDFRKMGGLKNILPLQNILTILGITSLIGFPFTTGFYSKENLLNYSYNLNNNIYTHYVYLILFISALFTILYNYYFYIKIYLKETKLSLFIFKFNLHYFSFHLLIPLVILSLFTIFFGFLFSKWFLFINLTSNHYNSFDFIPLFIKLLPLFFIIFILIILLFIKSSFNLNLHFFSYFYSFKFLYQFISGIFYTLSYRIFFKLFDYGYFDLLGPISSRFLINLNFNSFFNNLNPISLIIIIIIIYLF